jgi:lysophospholipase L1-like esterase
VQKLWIAVQKLWRGMAFRDRLRNLKVTNVSTQVADQELWMEDGVHMTEDGYTIVARHIICGLEAMEARRTASEVELDQEAGGSKKRIRGGYGAKKAT